MKIYVILFSLLSCGSALLSEEECLYKVETAKNIGDTCSKQLKILCSRHDILFTLWDASSKIIRTGLTAASYRDLGNYDVCVSVDTSVEQTDILGKFCPFQWSTVIAKKSLEDLVAVIETLPNGNSEFTHPEEETQNNILENESIFVAGDLCITDGCSTAEFNSVFNTYSYPVQSIDAYDCMTKYTRRDLSTFELLVTIFLALIVATVVLCTIVHVVYHYRKTGKPQDFIEGFSALSNGKKLFAISDDTKYQIQCMNGFRFISILWIIAGHGFSAIPSRPVVNEQEGLEWISSFYSQYIQSAIFAVDTFFFLSGFLLAYVGLNKMKNRSVVQQITGIPLTYLNRYLRLTPAVGAMYFTSISFYKLLGDGPLWFVAYDIIQVPCSKYWWRFFLYLQNYYPNELCFTQTWYLSADMQMFIFAPLILIPCSRYFEKRIMFVIAGLIILMGAFMGISIGIPYWIDGYSNNYDTHSRVSGYLVGVIGGVIFSKNRGKRIKMNKVVNMMAWVATLGMMMILAYCNYYVTQLNNNKLNSILFSVIYRPIWCTCLLWIVFSCYHGYGGFINWFLSNPLFQVGARLSYCMYILHGLLVLYSVGTLRTSFHFNDYEMINLVWGYINNCMILSILWYLIFEAPMIMLSKKLLGWIGSPKHKSEIKNDVA